MSMSQADADRLAARVRAAVPFDVRVVPDEDGFAVDIVRVDDAGTADTWTLYDAEDWAWLGDRIIALDGSGRRYPLDLLDGEVAALSLDGVVAGHLAITRGRFWSPAHPFRMQDNLWIAIRWTDGMKEDHLEDFPPEWLYAVELSEGRLDLAGHARRPGVYAVAWMDGEEREQMRAWIAGAEDGTSGS